VLAEVSVAATLPANAANEAAEIVRGIMTIEVSHPLTRRVDFMRQAA
jgi:hypothetical protein